MRPLIIAMLALLVFAPAALASHDDGVYDQPVWFRWETRALDTIIIPADHGPIFNDHGVLGGEDPASEAHPCTNSYTRAMVQSALDWKVAIDTFGPTWLKEVTISVYVLGCGPTPPQSALVDPEIIVTTDEHKGTILGVAVSMRVYRPTFGAAVNAAPCLALNSQMFVESFTYDDMYTVAGHEFGHCLGLNHVTHDQPDEDIMDASPTDGTIGSRSNPRHCPSNLNVNTLKGVFTLFGQPGSGDGGTMPVSSYAQIQC